ncbi:MAG: PilZ domain-containing protein [Desulfobacterium sp.]|jgi:hypothetical protein|nr:PilZ domain-containing protein [Desulfobacterium sp.]
MGDKNEESIEFQELIYDLQSTGQVRHSFRIPLDGSKQHLVWIHQASYPLIDIANHGVSFGIPSELDLMEGEILTECRLLLGDQTIEPVKAEVVHLSPGSDNDWICGIHWLDLDEDAVKRIEAIVQDLRKELFPGKISPQADLQIEPPLWTS